MAYGLNEILNYVPLTKSVEGVKTGVTDVLPDAFFNITENVPGNKAKYIVYQGTRQTARILEFGAPPRQSHKKDIDEQSITLLHSSEELQFKDELLTILRMWDKYDHQHMWAKEQIALHGANHRQRFDNLRKTVVHSFLANGKCWFDTNDNLLDTSSGAVQTIDQNIPAANIGTLSSEGVVTASWATNTTDIVRAVNNLKMVALHRTGYPLKYAFYGKNVAGYIAANTTMQNYMARNPVMNQKFISTGTIPDGTLDLTWIPVQNAFFENAAGTVKEIFPADQVTFFPELNSNTYTMFEGSMLVPSSFGPMADAMAALSSAQEVYGMFRYAHASFKPFTIFDVIGDTFMPRFKVPSSVFLIDTTP